MDLPLKNNYDMVEFFEENKGKEFIGITPEWAESPGIAQRYKLHWFFQDNIGKKKNILYFVSRVITKVEKHIGFKREKGEDIHFYGGPEWFSVTEQAARYILSRGDWAKNVLEKQSVAMKYMHRQLLEIVLLPRKYTIKKVRIHMLNV